MTEHAPIPLIIRTRLAHATLQAIADECGADILHIKGAAVDPALLPPGPMHPLYATPQERVLTRVSADADVLVRPAHLSRFLGRLEPNGWLRKSRFDTGGGAEHSSDFWHHQLGWADVHRSFPGIQMPSAPTFDRLWQDHGVRQVAHRPCCVPSLDAQRLILLLHAARNGGARESDIRIAWLEATEQERARTLALADELVAYVALAAATGNGEAYADRPDYDLWRLLRSGNASQFEVWAARVKASSTCRDRLLAMIDPLLIKRDAAAMALHREPTATDLARFLALRLRRDLKDVAALAKRKASTGRSADPRGKR